MGLPSSGDGRVEGTQADGTYPKDSYEQIEWKTRKRLAEQQRNGGKIPQLH